MTTLLEFILNHYLGEPLRTAEPGESYWECPNCASAKFHTMPDKPQHKHRTKCWSCGFGGDAGDMLREFHSGAYPAHAHLPNYADRKDLLEHFTAEFTRQSIAAERGDTDREEEIGAAVGELIANLGLHPPKSFVTPAALGLWAVSLAARIADQRRVNLRDIAALSADVLVATKAMTKREAPSC